MSFSPDLKRVSTPATEPETLMVDAEVSGFAPAMQALSPKRSHNLPPSSKTKILSIYIYIYILLLLLLLLLLYIYIYIRGGRQVGR